MEEKKEETKKPPETQIPHACSLFKHPYLTFYIALIDFLNCLT
jgi:hypothetical protein